MKKILLSLSVLAAAFQLSAVTPPIKLWTKGDADIKVYRIPALCTAPNGDLVAACDARKNHGGDLNSSQPINITIRRSTDGGATWTDAVNSYTWKFDNEDKWSGSDPSFVVDKKAKKIFLFYNVWHVAANDRVFRFYVQESADNGATWSEPRDISQDIAFPGWPFGKSDKQGGFIFISSGSGCQLRDGTLLHTLVHVGDGNALFGSEDHGKTWKPMGKAVKQGDECKVVELSDGRWMINSRWRKNNKPGRMIHISADRGETWESRYDENLTDPQCNAQIMRYPGNVLLFSNCNSGGRNNVSLRASTDDGETWGSPVQICAGGSAYSDITVLKNGKIGVLFECGPYNSIDFVLVDPEEIIPAEVRAKLESKKSKKVK